MNPVWSLELTDGSETVNLGMVQPPSIMAPVPEGFGQTQFPPQKYDRLAQTVENQLFLENWNLVIGEGDTDAVSTQVSKLLRLLRRAWQYWHQDRYNTPVYLIEKGACETESRYALVRECPSMNLPKPLANNAFESSNLINGAGISIARFIWREGVPGALPSLSTLTKTDGPVDDTLVHVSNFQDDHEMTHVYRYDRGAVWAADFERGDPDRMWIADNVSLSTGNIDFFVAGWFTLESAAASYGLLGKWDFVAANQEYVLIYNQANNRFEFFISDGVASDFIRANNFGAPSIATEYFIIAWHITATSELGIQINDTTPDTKVSARNPQDGTRDFTIGAYHAGVGASYDGLAKSCGMWKAECTTALRTSLYNCGFPKFYAELTAAELVGLQAWWEFGSAGLAFVNDSHGANNLTNVGATQIAGTVASFSANLYQSGIYNLFTTPAVGDILYLGSPTPFWHFMALIATAGNPVDLTLEWEYSDGAAGWPDLTLGDDLTLYPDDEPWDTPAGDDIAFNFMPGSDWAIENVNGQTIFWVRVRITCLTSWTTMTQIDDDYNQRTPEVRIPLALSDGDVSPYLMLRLRHPDGGDENPEMSCTSRIIIGKKSRGLTNFVSRLNLGNDGNPAGWAVTYGADSSAVADPRTPGGDWCNITFAGDTTMVLRATVTGTAMLADLVGEYRVFMRVFQVSGAAEELNVQLVVKINSAGADAPAIPFPERAIQDGGVGELVDMTLGGTLKIPFADAFNADDFTNGDIIFEIYAEQASGTSQLDLMDLILIPADEWIVDLNDPISNAVTGNSALRGLTLLDMDNGVVFNRTVKQIIDGANTYLAETWSRRSNPMNIEPATAARLYFLMGHYPSGGDWGDIPWIGSQGMHLTAELYKQNTFLYLRGDT